MAKENKSEELVDVSEDEGPEEGEIEDDTCDEDNAKNSGISTTNLSVGANYFQNPCTSSKGARKRKPQAHVPEKSVKCWGNTNRRRYKFYVDHDHPSREPYDGLKKSDVNSDRVGLNFHDLLCEYKTSKHDNEGNTHEKENRHYGKDVSLDSSRKRESLVNDVLAEKGKRSRKRKHRRSPSLSPVSSEPDSRKRKEIRTTRPRRRKKPNVTTCNSKESALIFARIRASKLNSLIDNEKKPSVELINVVSEGENQTEMTKIPIDIVKPVHSESESNLEKNTDTESVLREGEQNNLTNEPNSCVAGKGSCSASDSQTAEKIEDSESKDEDDDVLQLRMIALQSAFRAKYLARKRLGLTKKNPVKTSKTLETSKVDSILDDTEKLLEAVEDLTSSPAKEPECDTMYISLEEVPLPPDEPLNPPVTGTAQAEDLTPVDMELALTDEDEGNLEPGKDYECDLDIPADEGMHPMVRISRNLMKTKSIPVTIGRKQHHKVRQKSSIGKQEINWRKNLLEVATAESEGDFTNFDPSVLGMEDLYSMEIYDPAQYSADYFHRLDEDNALSEASDTKSDSISAYSGHIPPLSNENDDEDEELLRAKLLLDISKRHRKEEEAIIKSSMTSTDFEEKIALTEKVTPAYLVNRDQPASSMVKTPVKVSGDDAEVQAVAVSHEKTKVKRVVERVRKGHNLLKAQALKSAHTKQFPITSLVRDRVSKMSNRGKYQRINQIRTAISKKLDGNIQVTVAGSNSKSKIVTQVPKQQDRIVICLGEDSDDSDDDKDKYLNVEPQMDTDPHIVTGFGNPWEIAYNQMMDSEPIPRIVYPESGREMKVERLKSTDPKQGGAITSDFEKSVDLFLKEVRSVQELKNKLSTSGTNKAEADAQPMQSADPKTKTTTNTPQAAKLILKSTPGITPQAVRHLPFQQQEEYRRLKMKISLLEMQRQLKAGKISQAISKSNQKVVPVNSVPSLKSSQVSSQIAIEDSKSSVCEPKKAISVPYPAEDKGVHEISEKVHEGSTAEVTDGAIGDDIEDENVMREQLLRSRLRKRAAAKAVTPASTESECIQNLGSKVVAEDTSKLKLVVQSSCVVEKEGNEFPTLVKSALDVDNEKVGSSMENESTSVLEPVVKISKISEICDGVSTSKQNSPCETTNMQVNHKHAASNTESKAEKDIADKKDEINLKDVTVKNSCLEVKEVSEEKQVTDVGVDSLKVSEGPVLSSMKVNGRKTFAEKQVPSNSNLKASAGTAEKVNLQLGMVSTSRNQGVGSNESQLKELENKLLSERHVALDYLKELQQLLNKFDCEGNRLRQKEATVKKLRADLSRAEVSLFHQKKLMKQLALNVSSLRTHVTETRHKCTLLTRACQKLGNQIKQEEKAKGVDGTAYKVPTRVAELVKNELSNVLFHTKQLKKSGLPYFDSPHQFTSKTSYSVKKSGKKIVRVHQQPNSLIWAKNQLLSYKSHLTDEKNCTLSPSKVPKSSQQRSSLVKSDAAKKSTVGSESMLSSSSSIKKTSPVVKGLNTSGKLCSTKASSNQPDLSANQTAIKVVPESDSNKSEVVASSAAEEGGSTDLRRNSPSFVLMPSESSSKIDEEKSSLKEYESPLTSFSRNASEKSPLETISKSEVINPEESINLDPNVMLCPYDLSGVCQDEECTYQHQRRKGASKKS